MVAVREFEQFNNKGTIPFNTELPNKEHVDNIRTKAASNGHTNWKEELEAAGFKAGYPDNKAKKIRTGLVPFDVIEGIRKAIKNRPSELLDDSTVANCALLFLSEVRNGNINLNEESEDLVRLATRKDPIALSSFKSWMYELSDDWYFRNFNWADTAEEIVKTLSEISASDPENPNEEFFALAEHLKKIFEEIDNTKGFKDTVSKIENLMIDNNHPISDLIVKIHTGWRSRVKKKDIVLGNTNLKRSSETPLPPAEAIIRSFKRIVHGLVSYNNVELSKLIQMVKNNIDSHRDHIEDRVSNTGAETFMFMIRLGEALNEVITENPNFSDQAKKALEGGIDYLTETIKKDIDATIIDIINSEYNHVT